MPSTGRPAAACAAIATSSRCARSQARSAATAFEPGSTIQSTPSSSAGERAQLSRTSARLRSGWNSSRLDRRG